MNDALAKDILSELEPHLPCGAFLMNKVGRRGWERPRVCISSRLYRQYRVSDPWDPMAKDEDNAIGLGSVALRLGENRRQPAPHLKPKETAKKTSRAPSLPPVPRAPSKSDAPKSAPKSANKAGEDPEIERLRAQAEEKRRQAEQARSWPRRRAAPALAPEKTAPTPALPVRPEARADASPEPTDEPVERVAPTLPKGPKVPGQRRQRAGRFRMKSTAVSSMPRVRDVNGTGPETDEQPAPATAPDKSVKRSVGSGGLDDLFGAAAQAGRLRMTAPQSEGEE
jgi:hypothetical protein